MAFPVYPSDLNDAEWALLAPLVSWNYDGRRSILRVLMCRGARQADSPWVR
jgi:hypothetical protein